MYIKVCMNVCKVRTYGEKKCSRNERIVKVYSKWNLKEIVRGLR